MHLYRQLYEFSASAGAFEGYVYRRDQVDMITLSNWVTHLVRAWDLLPDEVQREIQASCSMTLGRAVKSLTNTLGKDHELIGKLQHIISGALPSSPDDFQKKKWFEACPSPDQSEN